MQCRHTLQQQKHLIAQESFDLRTKRTNCNLQHGAQNQNRLSFNLKK